MEENTMDKLMSMLNNGNIPDEMKNIISSMNSPNKTTDSSNSSNSISPEAINKLMSMLNSKSNSNEEATFTDNPKSGLSDYTNNSSGNSNKNESNSSNTGIDFETIMKFKTIMDKMNSKDDARSKLLLSLKPYLKESRKNKVDQYIQFFNMSKVIDVFSKANGDNKS